jgi:hypothetical protein
VGLHVYELIGGCLLLNIDELVTGWSLECEERKNEKLLADVGFEPASCDIASRLSTI